jgi:hypothetical protein
MLNNQAMTAKTAGFMRYLGWALKVLKTSLKEDKVLCSFSFSDSNLWGFFVMCRATHRDTFTIFSVALSLKATRKNNAYHTGSPKRD